MGSTIAAGAILRLRAVLMRAPQAITQLDFYVDCLGLQPLQWSESKRLYFQGSGPEAFCYGLVEGREFRLEAVVFGVPDVGALEGLRRRLLAVNAEPGEIRDSEHPGGGVGFDVTDPEGRHLFITAGDAARSSHGDLPGRPRGLSHIAFNTECLDRTANFFVEGLGFSVTDRIGTEAVYLRCCDQHHTVVLVQSLYPSTRSVAFEMPSIDGLMRGIGRMKVGGHPPLWGPGRQSAGMNTFAYFVSPSGFVLEYVSDMDRDHPAGAPPVAADGDHGTLIDIWSMAGPPSPAARLALAGRPEAPWKAGR